MISFPSRLDSGGSNISLPTNAPTTVSKLFSDMGRTFLNTATNRVLGGVLAFVHGANAMSGPPDTSRIPYDFSRFDELPLGKPLLGIDQSNMTAQLRGSTRPKSNEDYWYENSLVANPAVYTIMNTYRYTYDYPSVAASAQRKFNKDKNGNTTETGEYGVYVWKKNTLSPSLFNPYYGIQMIGATKNTPLIDSNLSPKNFSTDFTDCSISKLCEMSAKNDPELGAAKYKYADFMYCKDLGMPNNRLLTLRRFSTPVGDMIFGPAAIGDDTNVYSTPGDVGRLIGYFDTEDNKLEDILNYSFNAKWDELESKIDQKRTQEDDRKSPLGAMLNTFSAGYRENMYKSLTDGNNLLDWFLGGKSFGGESSFETQWYDPGSVLANYDKNKVYEPVDTIRSTHIYNGNLIFNHEFTLTFNYTLRSYDNINPKSAMLDLLANATTVCYRRGNFWGGRNEILGAQPNVAGWKKANDLITNNFKNLGGIIGGLTDGSLNFKGALAQYANFLSESFKEMTGVNLSGNPQEMADELNKLKEKYLGDPKDRDGLINGGLKQIQAKLMNALGRPQMYLFNSILTGDNVGLWHLTIGNPRNPIAVMGNLIMTDAKIQQYGPLGQDDFPTGLKVTVTLKHARPRDMVDIQKMYTRGIMAIYQNINDGEGSHFWKNTEAGVMYAGESSVSKLKRNMNELA